ncbi:MAG: hypothetical protein IJ761_00775 [Bacteroidales bacterium]|nr:hypothetical protein [Bacteroidales bacterium]
MAINGNNINPSRLQKWLKVAIAVLSALAGALAQYATSFMTAVVGQ